MIRNILFVDNNTKTLKGLKKQLYPMRDKWKMEFVGNGEAALNLLAKTSFDVIVSDMYMPGMDGVKLLGKVMELHPEIVRILLSNQLDKETVLKTSDSAHQLLSKPCNAETIKLTIERTCRLQDLLRNEELKKMVTGIRDLPSLPSLYGKIIEEMKSPDASLKEVGYIISQDVSMSAKILQLVNTAFFGLNREITDPQQAAVYLGIETLKALVLSIHVFSSFTNEAESYGFSLSGMWKHSLMVGKLAKDIARIESTEKKVVEEVLIAGMLHDIGRLIMLKIPRQYKKIRDFVEDNGYDLLEAEYTVLKTSHAELGAYLLGLWGIDDHIVEAVAFHHNPSKLLEDVFVMSKTPSNKEDDLKQQSEKKCLADYTTMTSVHVANALMMQKECFPETTVIPYADMQYLRTLSLTDKLPEWIECHNKVMQEELEV